MVLRVLYSIFFLTDQRLFNCKYFDDVCLRKHGSTAYITLATTTTPSADQLTNNKRIESKEQSRINCLKTIALDLKSVVTFVLSQIGLNPPTTPSRTKIPFIAFYVNKRKILQFDRLKKISIVLLAI